MVSRSPGRGGNWDTLPHGWQQPPGLGFAACQDQACPPGHPKDTLDSLGSTYPEAPVLLMLDFISRSHIKFEKNSTLNEKKVLSSQSLLIKASKKDAEGGEPHQCEHQ